MVPIGGFFTIDTTSASNVSRTINPHIILPMHYKTSKCNYPINGVDEFLKGKTIVKRVDGNEIEVQADKIPPGTEIVILKHAL